MPPVVLCCVMLGFIFPDAFGWLKALSTALFVAGEAQAARILEEQYPKVGAVLIRDDGSIRILGDVCFTEEAGA